MYLVKYTFASFSLELGMDQKTNVRAIEWTWAWVITIAQTWEYETVSDHDNDGDISQLTLVEPDGAYCHLLSKIYK